MSPIHSIIAALAVITAVVGLSIWYLSPLNISETTPPPSLPPPPQPPIAETPPPPAVPSPKKIPIFFLGQPMPISHDKQRQAALILSDASTRNPNQFGLITQEQAPDEIAIILQKMATALANFSAIDLVCQSIVSTNDCTPIDRAYQQVHQGFTAHPQLFPPEDGYTCQAIRQGLAPVLASSRNECHTLSNPIFERACQELPTSCTPNPYLAPCDLRLAFAGVLSNTRSCTDSLTGQRAYLCQGVQARDCNLAYVHMIEDYTYTELALSTGEKEFCNLVEDKLIKEGCTSGDKDTVRKDLLVGILD